jgi:hypothetical protein
LTAVLADHDVDQRLAVAGPGPVVVGEHVPDAAGDVGVVEGAVERDPADAVD